MFDHVVRGTGRRVWGTGAAVLACCAVMAADARAGAMVVDPNCNTSQLARNDDLSTGSVPIGFTVNFFGVSDTSLFVNNNGNVTLDSPLSTFTPFNLTSTTTQIIAPFFGDVDTRNGGQTTPSEPLLSDITSYGQTTFGGRPAFCVNWGEPLGIGNGVGYFSINTDKTNRIQLIIVDRSDVNPGDVDVIFNYDQIRWETGDASGGSGGLGGSSARIGYSNGTNAPGTDFELPGSAVNGAFLDSGPLGTRLITNSLNSPIPGRYQFAFRNGTPEVAGRMASNAKRGIASYASNVDCSEDKANLVPVRPFTVRWTDGSGTHEFKATSYTAASCSNDPGVNQSPAALNPALDTQTGQANGTVDGVPGHVLTWKLVDAGNPSASDATSLQVQRTADNAVLLSTGLGPLSVGQNYALAANR